MQELFLVYRKADVLVFGLSIVHPTRRAERRKFHGSHPPPLPLETHSGDDSWVDSSTRGVWEQEDIPRCSIGDGAVNALSTPTPFRKSMVLGSLSPVLMAVSPTVVSPNATIYSNSPKGILGGRRGTGNWDVTPPTPRPSPVKARKQNKKWNNLGGGGAASFSRRLRRESGGDEDQQRDGEVAESVAVLLLPGGSTAAPSQHKTSPSSSRKATVGVPRSGSSLPMEKVTPAASGSDGVRYRWARRNSSGKGWKWELDLRKSPTRRKVQTPVAKPITSDMRATATAAAKAGAAKAAKAAASALAKKKVASETVAKQVVVKQAVCISPAVTQNKNTEILELCCPGRNLVEGDEQEQGRLQRAGPTKSGEPSTGGLSEAVATAGLATMTVEKEELAEECCDAAAGGVEGPTLTLPSREGRGEEERVLRAALARINNLENGWMDGVKAYEVSGQEEEFGKLSSGADLMEACLGREKRGRVDPIITCIFFALVVKHLFGRIFELERRKIFLVPACGDIVLQKHHPWNDEPYAYPRSN